MPTAIMDAGEVAVRRRENAAEIRQVRARVAYSYEAEYDDELSLKVGDDVEVVGVDEEGWFRGRLRNKEGVFPSNFVEVTQGSADDLPVMPSSDHNSHENNDADNQDRSSTPGDHAQKRPRAWNAQKTSLHNVDADTDQSNSVPGKTSPRGTGGPPGALRAGFGNIFKGGPVQLRSVAKRGEQKSIVPAHGQNKIHENNKSDDAADESSPSSSDTDTATAAAAANNNNSGKPSSSGNTTKSSSIDADRVTPSPTASLSKTAAAAAAPASKMSDVKPAAAPPPPPPYVPAAPAKDMVKALYKYAAKCEDELSFKKGDLIEVITRDTDDDGWWCGRHVETNKTGLLPENFVKPVDAASVAANTDAGNNSGSKTSLAVENGSATKLPTTNDADAAKHGKSPITKLLTAFSKDGSSTAAANGTADATAAPKGTASKLSSSKSSHEPQTKATSAAAAAHHAHDADEAPPLPAKPSNSSAAAAAPSNAAPARPLAPSSTAATAGGGGGGGGAHKKPAIPNKTGILSSILDRKQRVATGPAETTTAFETTSKATKSLTTTGNATSLARHESGPATTTKSTGSLSTSAATAAAAGIAARTRAKSAADSASPANDNNAAPHATPSSLKNRKITNGSAGGTSVQRADSRSSASSISSSSTTAATTDAAADRVDAGSPTLDRLRATGGASVKNLRAKNLHAPHDEHSENDDEATTPTKKSSSHVPPPPPPAAATISRDLTTPVDEAVDIATDSAPSGVTLRHITASRPRGPANRRPPSKIYAPQDVSEVLDQLSPLATTSSTLPAMSRSTSRDESITSLTAEVTPERVLRLEQQLASEIVKRQQLEQQLSGERLRIDQLQAQVAELRKQIHDSNQSNTKFTKK